MSGDAIEDSRWTYRLIAYTLGESASAEALSRQVAQAGSALEERHVRFVRLSETGFDSDLHLGLGAAERDRWASRFGLDGSGTAFVLVGKDGGVKAEQQGELDLEAFFRRIDSMPMRQREMREQAREGM